MNTHVDKTQENKSQSVSNAVSQKQGGGESTFQFVDNRPETIAQRKLKEMTNNSPQVSQLKAFQEMANNGSQNNHATQFYEPIAQLRINRNREQLIQRVFHENAEKDAILFKRNDPTSATNPPIPKEASDLGIEKLNMAHYLERHSYSHQILNSKTIKNAATMFKQTMGEAEISATLVACLKQLTSGDDVTSGVEKVVDGVTYRMTSNDGKKLNGFFPITGHVYTSDELKELRTEKNKK